MSGKLFIVATPIGNLEDLTPRARQMLAEVDLIAAEDTRRTGRLLSHIGVKSRLMALHDHNEEKSVAKIIKMLQDGQSIALVSDAGTPLVSDPGYRLVSAAHENNIGVSPIPGASAAVAALSVAGLATDRFCFEGFGPSKKDARREWLQARATETRTMVFYESVHRISACFADLIDAFGCERKAFVGRELTKMHEQCVSATLGELAAQVAADEIMHKGELVIVVGGGATSASAIDIERLLQELSGKLPDKEIARAVAKATGEKRNALYQRLLDL